MKKLLEVSLDWDKLDSSVFSRLDNYEVFEVSSAEAAAHEPDLDENCRGLSSTVTNRRRGSFVRAARNLTLLKGDVKRFWRRFIAAVGVLPHGDVGLRDRQIEEKDS